MRPRAGQPLLAATFGVLALAIACDGSPAALVQVTARPDVPRDLGSLRFEVHQQGQLVQEQQLELRGAELPQTVALVSRGATVGEVEIRVQGLRRGTVEAAGTGQGTLSRSRPEPTVVVELSRLCPADGGACGCRPSTCAERDAGCGSPDDGCSGTSSCGGCVAPDTCGGGGQPFRCGRGCVPTCSVCGAGDGCGGTCLTGSCPSPGSSCNAGSCACASGLVACDGGCVDVRGDKSNCGACGHACPNAKDCAGGLCLCTEPADDVDNHCCPPMMTFAATGSGASPGVVYCFSSLRGPAEPLAAMADCRGLTAPLAGCVGGASAAPASSACKILFEKCGRYGSTTCAVADYEDGLRLGGTGSCQPCDGGGAQCPNHVSCSDGGVGNYGCRQSYYCVLDPLGPRARQCTSSSACPPGTTCDAGACLATATACCSDADCDGGNTCLVGGPRATGLCQ